MAKHTKCKIGMHIRNSTRYGADLDDSRDRWVHKATDIVRFLRYNRARFHRLDDETDQGICGIPRAVARADL